MGANACDAHPQAGAYSGSANKNARSSRVNVFATALSASIWLVIVTVIAYIGIQVTVRFQWVLAAVEYLAITIFASVSVLIAFAIGQWSVLPLQSANGP